MANWSNPTLTSTYTNFVTEVKDRDVEVAVWFEGMSPTNLPTNAKWLNTSNGRFEKWNGSTWVDAVATFEFPALKVAGATTLSGGTANGVAYLDGSKVLTTGTDLVFNTTGLGIGTSSPGAKLEVAVSGSAQQLRLASTGNSIFRTRWIDATAGFTLESNNSTETAYYPFSFTGSVLRFCSGDGSLKATLDSSGNLGLGVTPSAWVSNRRVLEIGGLSAASLALNGTAAVSEVFANATRDAGGTYRYFATAPASYVDFNNSTAGGWAWSIAPSGTAGNAITFTQAMTLSAGGDLFLGATGAAFAERFRMNGAYAVFDDASYTGFIGRGTALGTGTASDFAIRSSNALAFLAGGATERMRLDSSGNLGLGVTPSASGSTYGGSQMRTLTVQSANIVSAAGYDAHFAQNAYRLTDGTWRYQGNGGNNVAHLYSQATGGSHIWYTAPSGTAGNAISFTQAMTLDASGNLLVGHTTNVDNNFKIQTNAAASGVSGIGVNNAGGYGVYLTYDKAGRYSTDAAAVRNIANTPLVFETNNTERARIDSSGNLIRGASQAYASVAAVTAATPSFQTHGTSLGAAGVGQFAWNNTTAYLLLNKAGAGALGTHAIVTNGSTIGAIQFNGSDGTQFVGAATILCAVDGTPAAGVIPGNLRFLVADSTGTRIERFRFGPAGQLGIGGATYGTSGQVLVSGGASAAPSWGAAPAPAALSTASGSAPSYSARAWVNFNGTGTVAIRSDGNVTSITDDGVGTYTVNMTTAQADSNYCTVGTGSLGTAAQYLCVKLSGTLGTGTVQVTTTAQNNGNPTLTDPAIVNVAIFR